MRFYLLFICCCCLGNTLWGQIAWPTPSSTLHQRTRPAKDTSATPIAGEEIDLNGIWTGELRQNPGGIAASFEFTMQLRHHGIFLQGTSFVRFGDIYVELELSGYRQPNGVWKLSETKILRGEKPANLVWCIKHYELRVSYTKEGLLLTGPWWGDTTAGDACVPGGVTLKFKKKTV